MQRALPTVSPQSCQPWQQCTITLKPTLWCARPRHSLLSMLQAMPSNAFSLNPISADELVLEMSTEKRKMQVHLGASVAKREPSIFPHTVECVVLHEAEDHRVAEQVQHASPAQNIISICDEPGCENAKNKFLGTMYKAIGHHDLKEAFTLAAKQLKISQLALEVRLLSGTVSVVAKYPVLTAVAAGSLLVAGFGLRAMQRGSFIVTVEMPRHRAQALLDRAQKAGDLPAELAGVSCIAHDEMAEPVWLGAARTALPEAHEREAHQLSRAIAEASAPSSKPHLRRSPPGWGHAPSANDSPQSEPVYFDVLVCAKASDAEPAARRVNLLQSATAQLAARLGGGFGDQYGGASVCGFFSACDGTALRVRLQLHSVQELHALRDRFLSDGLEAEPLIETLVGAESLSEMRTAASAAGVRLGWSVDATPLVESYETAVLQLEQLTPHQEQKLRESRDLLSSTAGGESTAGSLLQRMRSTPRKGVRLDAPPGCGKTFIALHLLLERLQRGEHVLFVCRTRALALFVAKWICFRRAHEPETWPGLLGRLEAIFEGADGKPERHTLSVGAGLINVKDTTAARLE